MLNKIQNINKKLNGTLLKNLEISYQDQNNLLKIIKIDYLIISQYKILIFKDLSGKRLKNMDILNHIWELRDSKKILKHIYLKTLNPLLKISKTINFHIIVDHSYSSKFNIFNILVSNKNINAVIYSALYIKILNKLNKTLYSENNLIQKLTSDKLILIKKFRGVDTLEDFVLRKSKTLNIQPQNILTKREILDIKKNNPKNLIELSQIKGIGKKKLSEYGEDILRILNA